MSNDRPNPNGAAARLRSDIDRGRTRDKVAWPDPAVAPLGTDDEAAGTPSDPRAISSTRMAEDSAPAERRQHQGLGAAWVLVAVVVLLAIALVAWAISRSP